MPRNVRNFWIEAEIDGRKSRIVGGPVRKDGGFDLEVKVRFDGDIVRALRVVGTATIGGALELTVLPFGPWDVSGPITLAARR